MISIIKGASYVIMNEARPRSLEAKALELALWKEARAMAECRHIAAALALRGGMVV
jgi:hypothetical protein